VFIPEEDVTGALPDQALQNALENGHHERECLRVRKDGSRFDAIGHLLNLKDYFGKHSGFAEVTRDITVRKQAEEAVRRERDVSAAILHSLPGIFYMYDQNGHFVRWNQRFLDVTGYSAAEMEHLHPLDFFEAKDQPRLTERIENVFQSGSDEIEAFFISKNRQRHPYYFNGVREDFDGQPHLLGMGIDISTQRRAQEALRATDQRLRMAAKAANVGLWDWDIQTNQVFYSPEWKSQIGYEGDEIGSSFDEWQSRVHPADLEGALQRMFAFIADPRLKYNAEFRLRHRDGSYRCILSHASLMRDEHGKAIRMAGLARRHHRRAGNPDEVAPGGQDGGDRAVGGRRCP
jgi:PAS domain S-box-containing protein